MGYAKVYEISFSDFIFTYSTSHPARVRGLKHLLQVNGLTYAEVAPRAGAWIETRSTTQFTPDLNTLCGTIK